MCVAMDPSPSVEEKEERKRGEEREWIQFLQKSYGAGRDLEHEALGLILSTGQKIREGREGWGRGTTFLPKNKCTHLRNAVLCLEGKQ